MMEICREIETLYAVMLPDNHRAIKLLKDLGFTITFLKVEKRCPPSRTINDILLEPIYCKIN
ncbi:MAG: hypothetical protein PHH85_11285 [Candidatus Methanoperedens sp.]|nr:hypothetical protein [Candidatus Methanoperedens sp.]